MEQYILSISPKAFIRLEPEEIIISSKFEKATIFNKIGIAMAKAAEINNDFEANIVKVIKYLSFQ